MSYAQWVEEQEYNRDDSAWREAMAADNVDHFADERAYYCEEHDYEDYENACPFGHTEPDDLPDHPAYNSEYNPPF
jgi:hypothetical protein